MLSSIYPFKPGDLIVFSGLKLDAVLIRWLTKSSYSHVAMVLDTNLETNGKTNIKIIESTTYTSLPDFQNQQCKQGIQIHNLENWLNAYKSYGKAWHIPLSKSLSSEKIEKMQNWLWNLHERQVSYSCWKSIGAWLKINKYFVNSNTQNSKRVFCSELATQALQIAGAINDSVLACEQTPYELTTLPCFNTPILL